MESREMDVFENLAVEGRQVDVLVELQRKKRDARDRLREARAEMRRIDAELIGAGANGKDLVLMCW